MSKWYTKYVHYCHWCGKQYAAKKDRLQARFCCKAHKQAHYRAYKKYVTLQDHKKPDAGERAVTRKKRKKRQCDTCSANPDDCALWKNPKVQGCKRYLKKRKKNTMRSKK